MVPAASAGTTIDKGAQELRQAIEAMGQTVTSAEQVFTKFAKDISTIGQGARMVMAEAHKALTEAATAITEELAQETKTKKQGRATIEQSIQKLGGTLDKLDKSIEFLDATTSRVEQIQTGIDRGNQSLNEVAASHRAFAGGVRADMDGALRPVVDELKVLTAQANDAYAKLDKSLESHRDFVIQLSEAVRDIPGAAAEESLLLAGEQRLSGVDSAIRSVLDAVSDLHEALLVTSVATGKNGLAAKDGQGSPDSSGSSDGNQIAQVLREVRELRDAIERPSGLASFVSRHRR